MEQEIYISEEGKVYFSFDMMLFSSAFGEEEGTPSLGLDI